MPERVWCQDNGHYNHLPTPNRPDTLDRFWYWLFQHNFTTEVRYITSPFNAQIVIFWSDASAYALIHPPHWKIVNGNCIHTTPPEVLRIGCEHDYVVTGRPYNCYTEYKCAKCGHKTAIDSSD